MKYRAGRRNAPDSLTATYVDDIEGLTIRLDMRGEHGGTFRLEGVSVTGADLTARRMAEVMRLLPYLTLSAVEASGHEPGQDEVYRTLEGLGDRADDIACTVSAYRRAVLRFEPALTAVMDECSLSKATASRRIREAKDLGLLPERVADLRRQEGLE